MNRLTDKDFSFKCPMSWDDMEATANGKFCSKCRKEVFDLTNCSTDEVRALQDKHGSICGTIRVAQAAVVALSLSAAACHKTERTTGTPRPIAPPSNNAQPATDTGDKKAHTQHKTPQTPSDQPQVLGEICPPPKQDQPAQAPVKPIEPIEHPMILGKICPQPIPNEEANPPGIKIDI